MRKALVLLGLPLLVACGSKDDASSEAAAPAGAAGEHARLLHATCTSPQTYARLKELAFDQAADRRGGEASALDQIVPGTRASMVEPIAATGDPKGGVVVCSGRFLLEVPTEAGKRLLSTPIEFAAQAAGDGSGLVFELEGAEEIVEQLALIGGPVSDGGADGAPRRRDVPYDGEHRARHSEGPSFDCTRARHPSEAMICSSRSLAALDREMASLYYDHMARADEGARQLLRRSRDGFLERRDRCQQAGCIASVYEDRIAEIRRIASDG